MERGGRSLVSGFVKLKPGRVTSPVSRRHDLQRHRHSLDEIREIMNAMKTLAYMETRKLTRFLDAQQAVVANIEAAATDFLGFHDDNLQQTVPAVIVYLLIGTERGFCGDINQRLVSAFTDPLAGTLKGAGVPATPPVQLIVVGHKLHLLLEDDDRVAAFITGAAIAEEVSVVLQQVVQALAKIQTEQGAISLFGRYYGGDDCIESSQLLPPFAALEIKAGAYSHPPLLNLPVTEFLLELTEHYLFAALNEMLYTALMAENHHRVAHLDGAVQHLDDESTQLERRSNALRQEEITEEIEVILLNSDGLANTGVEQQRGRWGSF